MNVQYSGMVLPDRNKDFLNREIERFSARRFDKPLTDLIVKVDEHKKAGGRSLYHTHIHAKVDGTLALADFDDWELNKSIGEAFKKLEKEVRANPKPKPRDYQNTV